MPGPRAVMLNRPAQVAHHMGGPAIVHRGPAVVVRGGPSVVHRGPAVVHAGGHAGLCVFDQIQKTLTCAIKRK
jgi:hypothetical protein